MKLQLIAAAAILGFTTASAQWAKVYTTDASLANEIRSSAVEATTTGNANITIDPSVKYQEIDGFGHAITYAACYNLLKMTPEMRAELLKRTFSPTEGYGENYVRISIGCNDFSSTEYTLCDTKGPADDLLRNFSLHSDEINYVIPVLKEILTYNPGLKIMGSPWTPPRWMKTNGQWTAGNLKSDYYETYADYFVKFVKAFEQHGIKIHSVTPQNEPLNTGNSASCNMVWTTEAPFVKALAGKFHDAGIDTRIYLYDHNYDYDGKSDQNDFSLKILRQIGTDFPGYDLIAGTAFHKYTAYTDDWKEMVDIYNKTKKENIFTEASIGTWNNYNDLSVSLARDMRDLIVQPMLGYCRGSIVWNFVLDSNRSPNRPGGCQTCYGAVTMTPDGRSYTHTSHFYIMAHAALAAPVGARRVKCDGNADTGSDCVAAFANPDGSLGIMIANDHSSARTATVKAGEYFYTLYCPAKSIVTGRLGLTEEQAKEGVDDSEPTIVYEPRYLSGSFNNWPTPGNDRSILMDVVDGKYTAEVDFPGEGRFCIYGRNWKPKYCLHVGDPVLTGPVTDLQLHPEGDSNDADIYYNLIGKYRVTFDEQTLMMTLTTSASDAITIIPADDPFTNGNAIPNGTTSPNGFNSPDGARSPNSATPVYYDLSGRAVIAPAPGIYLRRSATGFEKVIIR